MHLDVVDPCEDPEPPGWEDFRRAEGLPAIWAYDVIAASCAGSWTRPLLGVFRDGERVTGAVGAVYLGLRRGARLPRPRREPLLLDVRLPGHSNAPTWHFSPGIPLESRRLLLRRFERAARRRLGWGLAGVLYRMVTEPRLAEVARGGAIVRESPGTTLMNLPWTSTEEWIRSLNRGRRHSLRTQIRRVAAADDLDVTAGRSRSDLDPGELAELNRRHTARLTPRFDPRPPLPAAYFAEFLRREDVTVLTYRAARRLLAFAVVFDHPVAPAYGQWAALPPEAGGRKDLYFDSYARVVGHALAAGAERLFAGRGLTEVKGSLGFGYVPMKLVAVPRWVMG